MAGNIKEYVIINHHTLNFPDLQTMKIKNKIVANIPRDW